MPAAPAAHDAATRASARGLDWFTFFLADIQTGFGPFVAVYLTGHHWLQADIGLVLTVGGLVALAGQMPAGALVDAVRSSRLMAAIAVALIGLSALAIAFWPVFAVVLGARILQAAASCVLGPVIAALSLSIAGHSAMGERLGRNARFASIGSGISAAAMGLCGFFISNQAVFFLTAALAIPAILALASIRAGVRGAPRVDAPVAAAEPSGGMRVLFGDRRLVVFCGCVMLFQLANAAMLPLMGSVLAMHASEQASSIVAACMVIPTVVVAIWAPMIGRLAQSWGRRPLLILCFAALIARGVLFGLTIHPTIVLAAQIFDGVSAAIFGVLLPLVVADITRDTGRFNLALGIVGSAVGVGASFSTALAGLAMDHVGGLATFMGLAAIAGLGLAFVWLMLPETRPSRVIVVGDEDTSERRAPAPLKAPAPS